MGFFGNVQQRLLETKGQAYTASARYVGGRGRYTPKNFGSGGTAIVEGYEACTWVYRCVRRKQDMVASVPWLVRTTDAEGAMSEDRLHPAAKRLNHPSAVYGRDYMFHRAAGFLSVVGNAILGKSGPGSEDEDPTTWLSSPVGEMRVESSIGVTPIEDGEGWILEYEVTGATGGVPRWDAASVIHVMLPSLSTAFWGMSELQALAMAVDTDVAGHRWNLDSFGAGGMPSYMMVDHTLVDADMEKARADMEDRFRSQGRQRTPWLVAGAALTGSEVNRAQIELHKLGMSAQEMDWLGGAAFTRDEIFVGLGFHPADASNERATHDNARAAAKQAWTGAALPLLAAFSSWFTLRMLTKAERADGMEIVPDLSRVEALKDDRESVAKAFRALTDAGLSVVDAAKTVNLPISDLPEYLVPRAPKPGRSDVTASGSTG